MTIDIDPIVREPSEFEKAIMEFYGYKSMFYFIQAGKEYSVKWTKEQLQEFLPNWCVSEYIENHLQKYASLFAEYLYKYQKGYHPFWISTRDENGKLCNERPMQLSQYNNYERKHARFWVKKVYDEFTKPLEFVMVKI